MKKQKPSGTLKKFLDVRDKNTQVVGSVERYLLARPRDTSRSTTVIHPSEMAKPDWCHRAQYHMLLGLPPAPSKFKTSLKQLLTFDEGHRIHGRWQAWLGEMGVLYGMWVCDTCKNAGWGLGDCGHPKALYKEVPVNATELRISGHADGWIKNLGEEDMLLEIKSVGEGSFRWEAPDLFYAHSGDMKKMWSNFKAPFMTHIMQVQIYLKVLEIMFPDDHPKQAVFIYENKASQEVKEFIIPKNGFAVDELFEAAAHIVAAVDKQDPPACNIDSVAGCYKCNYYLEDNNG